MCTVTIIPIENGVRLACNRDESRKRPAGLPPRVVTCGSRRALMPIDPQSGGTWIAANDAGLIFTLLNIYPLSKGAGSATPRRSRGTIIPTLLDCSSLEKAFDRAPIFDSDNFAPFHLVMADQWGFAEFYFNGTNFLRREPAAIVGPLLFTSSGLGDAVIDPPRRALFVEFFAAGRDWRAQQDAYHRHSWPERRHLSVCMSRPEARTVSLTIAEVEVRSTRMIYYLEAPDQPSVPIEAILQREPGA